MKPCFTKLCTAQRKVFCPDHKAILCYGCKDKLHTKCQVDEIVDPDRVQANITHLERVLEAMSKDNQRLEIETHIQGVPGFIKLYKSKIANTEAKLVDSVCQDRFLEYGVLLKHILDIWSNIKESEVYQKYCSLMVDFVVSYNLERHNGVESDKDHINTEASATSLSNQNTTQTYLDELRQSMLCEKLNEKVTEYDLQTKKESEFEIDLNIVKDVEIINRSLASNTKVKNIKSLAIKNCNKNISIVPKFLCPLLFCNISKLELVCDQQGPNDTRKIKPILPALTSAVQFMNVKEVHLGDWEFYSKDLNVLIDSCSGVETISIQRAFFCSWNGMKLDRNRIFRTKILKLSPSTSCSFATSTTNSLMHAISKSKLKESLNEIHMGVGSSDISNLQEIADSLGMSHIKLIKTS